MASGLITLRTFNGSIDLKKKIEKKTAFHKLTLQHESLGKVIKKFRMKFWPTRRIIEKKELDHEEIFYSTSEDLRDEWGPYLSNDVLSLAFSWARYTMEMPRITEIRRKIVYLSHLWVRNFLIQWE